MEPAPPPAPTDAAAIRRRNLGLVLRHLADHGPTPRTELAAATGLAHGSVTALVADLADRGLVAEDDAHRSGGRGRPIRPVRLIPTRAAVAAVQVTSEDLRIAVADLSGEIIRRDTVAHHLAPGTPEAMADAIAEVIARAAVEVCGKLSATTESGDESAHAVSPRPILVRAVIAMAGPVREDAAQTVMVAPDFGWMHPVRLGEMVSAALAARPEVRDNGQAAVRPGAGIAITVINDANSAALAEFHALQQKPRGLVLIEAGTGIGGGIVLDGRIHTGTHGIAGEPGHIPVAMDGPECVCGARGCLVTFAAPEAVLDAAGLRDLLHHKGLRAATTEFRNRLKAGDQQAQTAATIAARALGAAILSITALLDVEEIILGGLLAELFPWLSPAIEDRLSGRRTLAPAVTLRVSPATLGDDGILSGALVLARRTVLSDPTCVAYG